MSSLLLPFQPRFIVYTAVLLLTAILALELYLDSSVYLAIPLLCSDRWRSSAPSICCRLVMRCCAIIRCRRISGSFWRKFARRSVNIFSRAKKTERRFRATSARSFISAPNGRSISVRSARKTMSMPAAMNGCTIRSRPGLQSRSRSAFSSAAPTALSPIRLRFSIFRR